MIYGKLRLRTLLSGSLTPDLIPSALLTYNSALLSFKMLKQLTLTYRLINKDINNLVSLEFAQKKMSVISLRAIRESLMRFKPMKPEKP